MTSLAKHVFSARSFDILKDPKELVNMEVDQEQGAW